jgi:hypothetical protein
MASCVSEVMSGLELNRQLEAHSTKKRSHGLLTEIPKAPAASAGPADSKLVFDFR